MNKVAEDMTFTIVNGGSEFAARSAHTRTAVT